MLNDVFSFVEGLMRKIKNETSIDARYFVLYSSAQRLAFHLGETTRSPSS